MKFCLGWRTEMYFFNSGVIAERESRMDMKNSNKLSLRDFSIKARF